MAGWWLCSLLSAAEGRPWMALLEILKQRLCGAGLALDAPCCCSGVN